MHGSNALKYKRNVNDDNLKFLEIKASIMHAKFKKHYFIVSEI